VFIIGYAIPISTPVEICRFKFADVTCGDAARSSI
jgi:hypothetical protein